MILPSLWDLMGLLDRFPHAKALGYCRCFDSGQLRNACTGSVATEFPDRVNRRANPRPRPDSPQAPPRQVLNPNRRAQSAALRMRRVAVSSPSDSALIVIGPFKSFIARTITRHSPLNALRSFDWNDSKLVASPLSVATISPGPDDRQT